MKNIFLFFLLISHLTFSQETIKASNLLEKIKKGELIEIKNTIINGDLDLTFMQDTIKKLPSRNKWWNKGNSNTITKTIVNKISFINCTFNNNVLAYIPDEDSGYTFIANFKDEVIFKNCTFKDKAMFKYSEFKKNTDFSGTIFFDDNTFKYSKFYKKISFENVHFKKYSTFKYTNFKTFTSFKNSIFEKTGIFKYTKFNKGVSFNNVKFKEDLNVKYVKIYGDFDTTKMEVENVIDAKYADINGTNINKHFLK